MAHTVASATDLPFVLGLSERDPDAVVAQARRLLDAVPRPPVALMAQIGDADPAVAAAALRRLHDATGSASSFRTIRSFRVSPSPTSRS